MKKEDNPTLKEIQNKITSWENSKGRIMKSYLPTQHVLSLLQISERVENKSPEEEELIQKTRELMLHAVEMLIETCK